MFLILVPVAGCGFASLLACFSSFKIIWEVSLEYFSICPVGFGSPGELEGGKKRLGFDASNCMDPASVLLPLFRDVRPNADYKPTLRRGNLRCFRVLAPRSSEDNHF